MTTPVIRQAYHRERLRFLAGVVQQFYAAWTLHEKVNIVRSYGWFIPAPLDQHVKDSTVRLPRCNLRLGIGKVDPFRFHKIGAQANRRRQVEVRVDDYTGKPDRQKIYVWFQTPATI